MYRIIRYTPEFGFANQARATQACLIGGRHVPVSHENSDKSEFPQVKTGIRALPAKIAGSPGMTPEASWRCRAPGPESRVPAFRPHQHRVAVGIETVALPDRVPVRIQHEL